MSHQALVVNGSGEVGFTSGLAPHASSLQANVPDGMQLGEDFPMVCEQCLGDNPYVRMIKAPKSAQCTLSGQPFTSFRWRVGSSQSKDTIICYPVAAEKNVCQCCLCDMEYGLPMGVRDAFLQSAAAKQQRDDKQGTPSTAANISFHHNSLAMLSERGDEDENGGGGAATSTTMLHAARQMHMPFATGRRDLTMDLRRLPRLCAAWVNGKCTRVGSATGGGTTEGTTEGGDDMGSVEVTTTDGEEDKKSHKNKFKKSHCHNRPCCGTFAFPELKGDGHSTEVHDKLVSALNERGPATVMLQLEEQTRALLRKGISSSGNKRLGDSSSREGHAAKTRKTDPCDDESVTTLVLTGLADDTADGDIKDVFSGYGQVKQVRVIALKKVAFVEFVSHAIAKMAMDDLQGSCNIGQTSVGLRWATAKKRQIPGGSRGGRGRGGSRGGARGGSTRGGGRGGARGGSTRGGGRGGARGGGNGSVSHSQPGGGRGGARGGAQGGGRGSFNNGGGGGRGGGPRGAQRGGGRGGFNNRGGGRGGSRGGGGNVNRSNNNNNGVVVLRNMSASGGRGGSRGGAAIPRLMPGAIMHGTNMPPPPAGLRTFVSK